MLKAKNIAIPAVFGFAVSFLISLLATHKFGFALLRGMIFAVVFAGLAIGITFLYEKFLSESNDEGSSSSETKKTGSVVDITINDESLPDDGQGPQFFVGNNKHNLEKEDKISLKTEDNADSEISTEDSPHNKDADSGFKAVPLEKTFASKKQESASIESASEESDGKKSEESFDEGIDTLPDISNLVSDDKPDAEDNNLIKDSDFAESGSKEGSHPAEFPNGSKVASHDTETMAKAIRTLLKNDE